MQRGPGQPWDGATGAIAVQTHHAEVVRPYEWVETSSTSTLGR